MVYNDRTVDQDERIEKDQTREETKNMSKLIENLCFRLKYNDGLRTTMLE